MPEQRRPGKYPDELRERAVRMVFESERHANSQWDAICSVAEKLGSTAETVRKWVRRVEIDERQRPGLTTDERQRLKELEREVRELRRENFGVYGADKVWAQLTARASGSRVARWSGSWASSGCGARCGASLVAPRSRMPRRSDRGTSSTVSSKCRHRTGCGSPT